jgi:hypothetical protein
MKSNPLTAILLAVLALSAIVSLVLCWAYIHNATQLRGYQSQIAAVRNNQAATGALLREAIAYSKTNSDMRPILSSFGIQMPDSASEPNHTRAGAK